MSGVAGTWDMTLRTPIGSLSAVYTFTEAAGRVTGTAQLDGPEVALTDVRIEDRAGAQRVTWQQSVTKPLRLNLQFDVTVIGDVVTGHSRAGRLPRSQVVGERRNSAVDAG